MKTALKLYGGVEGGGTKTLLTIVDENGRVMGFTHGGPTNPWTLSVVAENGDGFLLAARRINDMVVECMSKIVASESETTEYQLVAVALCLSGGGTQAAKVRLNEAFAKLGPSIPYQTIIGNDTLAALFTACKNGGIVVISGTGSNCILLNPLPDNGDSLRSLDDLSTSNSGGWGQMLGDEGSAYWIAQKSIKYVIDHNDNFLLHDDSQPMDASNGASNNSSDEENKVPHQQQQLPLHKMCAKSSVDEVRTLIYEHFQVSSLSELLPYFYSDFKKDFIASLTVKLSQIADKNEIVKGIFEEAGYQIARHIVALHPKISQSPIDMPHGLPIVCVGSVFKSWHLVKPGFVRCLYEHRAKSSRLRQLNLMMIAENSTIGAAILASKLCGNDLSDHFVGDKAPTAVTSRLVTVLDNIVLNGVAALVAPSAEKKAAAIAQQHHHHHIHHHHNHNHHSLSPLSKKKAFKDKSNNSNGGYISDHTTTSSPSPSPIPS